MTKQDKEIERLRAELEKANQERDEARRLAEHWRSTQSRVHGSLDRMTLRLSEEMVQWIESGGGGSAGERERLQNARMNIEEFRRKEGDERFPWECDIVEDDK